MRSDLLLPLSLKDPRSVSPLIEKIMNIHQKNQQKQMQARKAQQNILVAYGKRKNSYQLKIKERQNEVMKRVTKLKKDKAQLISKQSKHVQQILQKFHKLDEQKQIAKREKITKRNLSSHRCENLKKQTQVFQLTQDQQNQTESGKKSSRCPSNSLDLQAFYKRSYQQTKYMCKQLMKKSELKQMRADQNRKLIQLNSKTKQLNQAKMEKRRKASQQYLQKQNILLKKSITKLELFQKRNQEQLKSQRKKSIEKRTQLSKQIEQRKKMREKIEQKLKQNILKFQKIIVQKQKKVEENRQACMQTILQARKSKRMKRIENTQTNFSYNSYALQQKLDNIYKKDREHWGFVTTVNQFKDNLISKNIYQNNQLALLR